MSLIGSRALNSARAPAGRYYDAPPLTPEKLATALSERLWLAIEAALHGRDVATANRVLLTLHEHIAAQLESFETNTSS